MSGINEDTANLVAELNVPYRYEIAREWALCARDVATATQLPRALEVWEFLDDRTTIGVPMPGGGIHYFFREKPERPIDEYAFLAPILPEDRNRMPSDDFRLGMIDGSYAHAAEYREGSGAIYLPAVELGRKGKGVLLLHEGLHAMLDRNRLVDRSVEHAHWIEEAEVYKFEFALLGSLIGEGYDKLVRKVADSIGPEADNPNHIMIRHTYTGKDRAMIARHMETANDKETGLWLSVMQINAFWEYFKKEQGPYDPDTELAKMIRHRQATDENRNR
ncbi:MAG TPA: hypothetical protein VK978_02775 [Candidatus Saccharimonadales bacterium]|nr:hypothetical protein [Candidatus Saccharimonadales bacterium]